MSETTTANDYGARSIETDRKTLVYETTKDLRDFRDAGDQVATFMTDGRQFRPFLNVARGVYGDEVKAVFTDDGVRIRHHDPANVCITHAKLHAEGLHHYDLFEDGEYTVGVGLNKLQKATSGARYGKTTKDPVEVAVGNRSVLTTVTREYDDGQRVATTDDIRTIDPDSVRTTPGEYDLGLGWEVDVPPQAFVDVVSHISNRDADVVRFVESDGALRVEATADDLDDISAEFSGARRVQLDGENGDSSLLSLDYVRDIAKAVDKGKVTDLSIRWGAEYPVEFDFERNTDDGTTLYDGHFMQAPRVQSDSDKAP